MALPHFSLSPLFGQTWIPFFPCPHAATLPFFLYLSVSPAHIPRGAVPAPGFMSLCYALYSSLHWGLHGDPAHSVVSHHLTPPPSSHGPSLLLCLLFCQFPTACPCFPGTMCLCHRQQCPFISGTLALVHPGTPHKGCFVLLRDVSSLLCHIGAADPGSCP